MTDHVACHLWICGVITSAHDLDAFRDAVRKAHDDALQFEPSIAVRDAQVPHDYVFCAEHNGTMHTHLHSTLVALRLAFVWEHVGNRSVHHPVTARCLIHQPGTPVVDLALALRQSRTRDQGGLSVDALRALRHQARFFKTAGLHYAPTAHDRLGLAARRPDLWAIQHASAPASA